MRVPTKDALSLALFCVTERALSYLCGQTQPSGVETVQVAGKLFASGIQLLQLQIKKLSNPAEPVIVDGKAVKLMAVNCHMTLAIEFPRIMLIHRDPDQVRHEFRQPVIVVPFHPDNFNLVPGIGELADVAQEFPVLLGQSAEIQVGEDVAQKNQARKLGALQELQGVRGAAYLRTKVQVGNNNGVKTIHQHALLL